MNNHKTVDININSQTIAVDEEMANVIIALNDLGLKTSGCCIGSQADDIEDEAYIIIQETNEYKIIGLMQRLNGCNYTLTKELYKKNIDNVIYTQYILKTPKKSWKHKVKYINEWFESLVKNIIITIPREAISYKSMNKLFKPQWIDISFKEMCEDYKDSWQVQYKLFNNDSWIDYDMVNSSLKSLIALNQMNAKWRYIDSNNTDLIINISATLSGKEEIDKAIDELQEKLKNLKINISL